MERNNNTLQHYWCRSVRGYPILVEEHQSDLSYIVEFYDGRDLGDDHCVSFLPNPEELITIDMVRGRRAA